MTRQDLKEALWQTFQQDLPLATTYLENMACQTRKLGQRQLKIENPNSDLGKQIIRLIGTDIARQIVEGKLGVAFGLYNCCSPVCALTRKELNLSLVEQISLQNGELASADC